MRVCRAPKSGTSGFAMCGIFGILHLDGSLVEQSALQAMARVTVHRGPDDDDPGQPRIEGTSVKTRFRHYLNLHRTAPRLRSLLADFRWGRMDEVFPQTGH